MPPYRSTLLRTLDTLVCALPLVLGAWRQEARVVSVIADRVQLHRCVRSVRLRGV
jgi:hypothetical protein